MAEVITTPAPLVLVLGAVVIVAVVVVVTTVVGVTDNTTSVAKENTESCR